MLRTVLQHSLKAKSAYDAAVDAERLTLERFPGRDPHNDEADAYRHALWSHIMTQSMGADTAKTYTDTYERWRPNPDGERYMDLYNNQVGRSLPGAQSGNTDPRIDVDEALKKGYLRQRPFGQ
jgi:hypothetical protein